MSPNLPDSARQYWEERYAGAERAWSGNPNPVLVAEATPLRPGRALDIGSGEGADALWLARRGWTVTGVDIAANALEKARAHTESADREAAGRIDWQQRDLTRWHPEAGSYDLVTSQFLHLPEPARSGVFRSLAAAVAPGGTVLIVGHDVSDVGPDSPHQGRLATLMFGVDDVLAAIDDQGLHIDVAESRMRGGEVPVGSEFHRDVVVKASRAPSTQRPSLTRQLESKEFQRWYWLKDELADFARSLGIRASGGKELLAMRIVAFLERREFLEPPSISRPGTAQLAAPLTSGTRIPVGQRCSQVLRVWFTEQLGSAFHFDAEMRAFFAHGDGTRTLADALEHWRRTRNVEPKEIARQFEYNQFTRSWHGEHPDGTRDELLSAWKEYRSSPIDARGNACP